MVFLIILYFILHRLDLLGTWLFHIDPFRAEIEDLLYWNNGVAKVVFVSAQSFNHLNLLFVKLRRPVIDSSTLIDV